MARKMAGLSFRTEHGAVWKDSFHPQATQERIPEPEAQHAISVDGTRQSKSGNTQYQQCLYCGSLSTVKNGFKHGSQCYKCKDCGRQFIAIKRFDNERIKTEYIDGKQTIAQLAITYGVTRVQYGAGSRRCATYVSFPNTRM